MPETYRAWKLVRLFKENRFTLALKLTEKKASDKARKFVIQEAKSKQKQKEEKLGRKLTDSELDEIIEKYKEDTVGFGGYLAYKATSSYHKEATVERNDLVELYISTHCSEMMAAHEQYDFKGKTSDKVLQAKKVEINSIIEGCIEGDDNFIKKDTENPSQIYLTGKGKKFSSIDGLLIAWAIYLKPLGLASIVGGIWALRELIPHIISFIATGSW